MGVSAARRQIHLAPAITSGLVAAGFVLVACGGPTVQAGRGSTSTTLGTPSTTAAPLGDPTTTVTTLAGSTTSPPTTTKPATTKKATPGPLAQRDAPLGGAGDQVSFVQGAGDPPACSEIDTTVSPAIVADANYGGPLSIASHSILCFPGFTNRAPVEAVITSPNGTTTRRSVTTSEGDVVYMVLLGRPGDQLGRYAVTATQGGARATGGFTVQVATQRQGIVLGSDSRSTTPRTEASFVYQPEERVGATLDVVLAGFAANQQVTMKFYRAKDGPGDDGLTGEHRARVTIRVNGRGEAVYVLDTRGAQRGNYLIKTEPALEQFGAPTFRLI